MKVTDEELMHAVWVAQLKRTAKGVINTYMGGGYAVCEDEFEFNYYFSCGLYFTFRDNIDVNLGNRHKLTRLKKLRRNERISSPFHKGMYMIDNQMSRDAFSRARQFWLNAGVPTGYDDRKARTVFMEDFEQHLKELERVLISEFPCYEGDRNA